MLRKTITTIGALGLAMAMAGCHNDRNETKLQYMPDMVDAPTVKAQKSFINPPDYSLATNAIIYPDTFDIAEAELTNNIPQTADNLAKGKDLFLTYCAVCHGPDAKGDGYLGKSYPTQPPDLTRADLAAHKDGFFFMKITQGGPIMPAYGYATTHVERWQIVSYLRTLQK